MIFNLVNLLLILIISLSSCAPISRRRSLENTSKVRMSPVFSPIKKKVALLPLFNESLLGGEDLAVTATEELRKELFKAREFIIDNEAANLFGSSKEVYSGGGVKLSQLARKAKLSGVNIVILGRIKEAKVRQKSDEVGIVRKVNSYAQSNIELRVFDVMANKEILSASQDGNITDGNLRFYQSDSEENLSYRQDLLRYSVRVAMRKFIPQILSIGSKLDWMGRVAKIIGTKIYINAGRSSGVNVGDILKVITEGEEIFDPESGALIGLSQGQVKGTLEVIDYVADDGAVCILHSGGSVTEGDFIQLY